MSREATESSAAPKRPRRLRAARACLAACPVQFAGLIVLAHLLVAAHTVAHFYQPPFESASQHCAICKIGKQSAGVPTAAMAASPSMATWVARFASPPAPSMRRLDGANFARAPPSAAPPATIG